MTADAGRRGYTHLLDAFWSEAQVLDVELPTAAPVSGAAFCKARRKLDPVLLQELILEAAATFDGEFGGSARWKGLRILAVDGCRMNTQRGTLLNCAYGTPKGAHCPQLLASVLFDVIARVPQDVGVAPNTGSERKLLTAHLDVLREGDVVVLDRGYPSYAVVRKLSASPADFVLRLPVSHTFPFVHGFVRSGDTERRVELILAAQGDEPEVVVSLRAVSLEGPDGVPMILLTSLDESVASRAELKQLYKLRWEVETFFGLAKSDYLDQGQFHARHPVGVEQEIYALCLFVSLSRFLMAQAAAKHDVPVAELSTKAGVLNVAGDLVPIMLLTDNTDRLVVIIEGLLHRIARRRYSRREGRSSPRRSLKPSRKWGPNGRRGG